MQDHNVEHQQYHDREIKELAGITHVDHMKSELVEMFRKHKYNLKLCSYSFELLLAYLQEHQFMTLLSIVNQHLFIKVLSGAPKQNQKTIGGMTGGAEIESLNKKPVYWGTVVQPEVLEADEGDDEETADDEGDGKPKKKGKRRALGSHPNAPKSNRVPFPTARAR